ncbi:MAG: metallophosphoesterase [Polyangiales bacterium]
MKIAVLHHPVSPLPDTEVARFGGLLNAGAVKEALLAKGFHLVLHGHVHRGWFAQERQWGADGAPRTLAVASAPTLGSRETAKDQGFNEIEVARDYGDDGRAHYRVAVRRYVRDNATWRADGAEMTLDPIPA